MRLTLNRTLGRRVSLACLVGVFIVSAIALFFGDGVNEKVLLFFGGSGDQLVGEERYLPSGYGRNQQLRLLVDELILGPRVREHKAAFPRSVDVQILTLGRDTAYLDLDAPALFENVANGLQEVDRLRALAATVLFNMPWLQRVWIFVDGQVPDYEIARFGWERPCC